ncbi:MAG: hypothetical protein ACYDCL_00810 [Myxococcales bacterium]
MEPLQTDVRGWLEGHLDKLLAFIGSAALSAAVISRLLPAPALHPVSRGFRHAHAEAAVAPVAAATLPHLAIAPPTPVKVSVPPAQAARPAQPAVLPVAHAAKPLGTVQLERQAAHRSKHRAKPHLRRATARNAMRAERPSLRPPAAPPVDVAPGSATDRWISEGTQALRRHAEAEAIHDFEKAEDVAGGRLPRQIGQKLSLLHVAAALRDRRAGNEAGARREFEAAHRADPGNARANAELAVPDDGVELRDAIDPD